MDVDEEGKITLEPIKGSPVDESFGIWKDEIEGLEYAKRLRKEWEARAGE